MPYSYVYAAWRRVPISDEPSLIYFLCPSVPLWKLQRIFMKCNIDNLRITVVLLSTCGTWPQTADIAWRLHQFVLAYSRKLLDIEQSKSLFELKFQRKTKLTFGAQKYCSSIFLCYVASCRLGRRRPQVDEGKRRRAEMDAICEYTE